MNNTNNSLSPVVDITEKVYWQDSSQTTMKMGLGWEVYTIIETNGLLYVKNGQAGGCSSIITFTKEPMIGVVVIGNSDNLVDPLATTLMTYLLGLK